MRIVNHRDFEQAAADFKNFKMSPHGQELMHEVQNQLLPVVAGDDLLKQEELERLCGVGLFIHFASYCPKCDQLNWHKCEGKQSTSDFLGIFSHKTCCQTCGECYLVGDNLDRHYITWWHGGCLLMFFGAKIGRAHV